jgi:hypothetical protein
LTDDWTLRCRPELLLVYEQEALVVATWLRQPEKAGWYALCSHVALPLKQSVHRNAQGSGGGGSQALFVWTIPI